MRLAFVSAYIFSCCVYDQSHLVKMLEPQTFSGSAAAMAKNEKSTVDATSESPPCNTGSVAGNDDSGADASVIGVGNGKGRDDVRNGCAAAAATNGDSAGDDISGGGGDGSVESSNGAAGSRTRLTKGVFVFTLHLGDGGHLQLAYGDKARSPCRHLCAMILA